MNGTTKFHKATGPAFYTGEIWYSHAGNIKVEIVSVRKYNTEGNHTSDYEVTYLTSPDSDRTKTHSKDAWNFQVRYGHQADRVL